MVADAPYVFISYRRSDSPDITGRIYDRLVTAYGRERVFKDVHSLPLGEDFLEHLGRLIGQCGVLIAVIGKGWLDARNMQNQRRLDDPSDVVRMEIEQALGRGVPVIPLLVRGAAMPNADDLPESLRPLVRRTGQLVRADPDFHNDMDRLIRRLPGPAPSEPLTPGEPGVGPRVAGHAPVPDGCAGRIDRSRYLDAQELSAESLAMRCGCSAREVQQWAQYGAGSESLSPPGLHDRICQALSVSRDFFDAPELLSAFVREEWRRLETTAPAFHRLVERKAGLSGDDAFQAMCVDIEYEHGAGLMASVADELPDTVRDARELEAVERFYGAMVLLVLDPEHQLSVNVDGAHPVELHRGMADLPDDWKYRFVIHYLHSRTIGPMIIELEDGELRPSTNAHELPEVLSALEDERGTCERFVEELAEKMIPGEFEKYRSRSGRYTSADAFETLRRRLDSRLGQHMRSRHHTFGIASTSVPEARAERIKSDYLPSLRVARMIDDSTRGLFRCEEVGIASFLVQTAEAFEACRSRVQHTLQIERRSAGPVVFAIAGEVHDRDVGA